MKCTGFTATTFISVASMLLVFVNPYQKNSKKSTSIPKVDHQWHNMALAARRWSLANPLPRFLRLMLVHGPFTVNRTDTNSGNAWPCAKSLWIASFRYPTTRQRRANATAGKICYLLVCKLQLLSTPMALLFPTAAGSSSFLPCSGQDLLLQMQRECRYCMHITLSDALCNDLNLFSVKGNC
jgi:hypothetical protein